MADADLYIRKPRRRFVFRTDYTTTFRFRKENVAWLANHFVAPETCKDYNTRVEKMKICLRYLADNELDEGPPGEDPVIDETACETIAAVIGNIAAKADNWIKFPQTPAIITQAKNVWRLKNKFPTAIGVIDCRHVPLDQTQLYGDEYINPDGLHTLNVQATCDGREMFTSVDTRWPGSVEDSLIWKHSIIRDIMTSTFNTVLLADDEYNTEPWLMTPYDNPKESSQINYNKLLKEERVIIDRCFGQLNRRFPILNCINCKKHEVASDIITACFVLHNIAKCLGEKDFETPPPFPEDVDQFNIIKIQKPVITEVKNDVSQSKFQLPKTPCQMMSNTPAFGNGLQKHNLTTAIDYISQNGTTTLATYPTVTTTESGLILDKQNTAAFFPPTPNPTTFYSTQVVAQPPGTILITNNFRPDESSTISGVNNNFNNSSIRIVTNNNNANHTNKNNNNNDTKSDFNTNNDKKPQQQQQQYHHLHHLHPQPQKVTLHHTPSTSPPNPVKMPNSIETTPASGQTTTSTVVLDRINICINNHYGDASVLPSSVPISVAVSPSTTQNASIASPIIPSVIVSPHTTTVDKVTPCVPAIKKVESSVIDVHIDEPDSTTPTHCHTDEMAMEHQDQEQEQEHQELEKCIIFDMFEMQKFEIGEDALVKRRDGRYYLGTVVDIHRQQYLVQFDDKTDYWSNVDELMKLSTDIVSKETPTCLSCKRENDDDIVEICERCGRGYHRTCTDEVSQKSGEWMCKRCEKPMKYSLENEIDEKPRLQMYCKSDNKNIFKQLPYALDSLTWDEKHRVNLEQIYCYCGKSGQFDNNMIQCCKCKQWFHVHCVDCVETLFRGDVFFIFGCSVCNNGIEFLRRIQMQWVDLAHLVLYNMAILKNFQKYHHLYKEIYPFVLEKRTVFQLPKSILKLSDNEFKANLLKTLQAHPKLFQCGKEIKKDHAFWGLRSNKPPQGPTYDVQRHEVLCNQLIREKLKINILPSVEEGEEDETEAEAETEEREEVEVEEEELEDPPKQSCDNDNTLLTTKLKRELNVKPELEDDDDKFTSDDEIPIKLIIEKGKTSCTSLETKLSSHDSGLSDLSNEPRLEEKEKKEKKEDAAAVVKFQQKSSRKRKAFTLSKGCRESDKSKDLPRNICDSSSDENSSSSRGTLDLIIPPPKNFLGINNPFRMVTPKKSHNAANAPTKSGGNNCITKKTVSFGSNSIFTNSLDLNSKIAALKSSGLFPNISNSDIAKAAGQPRLVRTIKRRLSAKDIMIGPNQEVRRRRTRPLSSNVEVISTTTINPIPNNFCIRSTIPESANTTTNNSKPLSTKFDSPHITSSASTKRVPSAAAVTTHGRRLRKRPEKISPQNIRRHSISSSSSSNSLTGGVVTQLTLPPPSSQPQNAVSMSDLKQSVNKYFGAANRIQNGENFNIRAKRRLTSGQMQYLIEWES